MGLFDKLKQGLKKTTQLLNTDVRDLFKAEGRLVDESFCNDLFEKLVKIDMGVDAAQEIADQIGEKFRARVVEEHEIIEDIKSQLKVLLAQPTEPIRFAPSGPTVIMVAGVNGCGKTTTIAKLTQMFQADGRRVVLGAADTFRAGGGRTVDDLGEAGGSGNRHRRLGQRSGQRRPSRRGPHHRTGGRRLHRRYGRPAANAAKPDAAVDQNPPRLGQADCRRPA